MGIHPGGGAFGRTPWAPGCRGLWAGEQSGGESTGRVTLRRGDSISEWGPCDCSQGCLRSHPATEAGLVPVGDPTPFPRELEGSVLRELARSFQIHL